jgi:hypothetical protein
MWDGAAWSIKPSPDLSGESALIAVSCVSATFCAAVGERNLRRTLVERWDGAAWSIIPSPNPSKGGVLTAVSCVSATDCTAVGFVRGCCDHGTKFPADALAEHWNGTTWSITRSRGAGPLYGVSCVAATDCTAVGTDGGTTSTEHWNGNKWSIIHSPTPRGAIGELDGVSCVSAADCTAVGFSDNDRSPDDVALVEHRNGQKWSIIPSSNPFPIAVSCVSATFCAAVSGHRVLYY